LDALLSEPIELHCVGAFVLAVLYGLPRPTGDIDYVSVLPPTKVKELQALAGPGLPLTKKYKVYLQHVPQVTLPEDYGKRLAEMFAGRFKKLRIYALDAYDLVLSKLERNGPKDREDVRYLANKLALDSEVLRKRYEREMRPYLAREKWHDQTLQLWIESYFS